MKQTAWGMLIGLVAIGLVSLLVFYVVPQMTGARLPLQSVRGAWITVHFPSASPLSGDPHRHLASLEAELAALAATVGLSPANLPPRINVFVHNDMRQLFTIVAQRKNPQVTLVFPAAVDLIWGEDPRAAFIQLIGDFAFGQNRSRLLRHALIEYIREPGRNHHLPVAALPEVLRLSVGELLRFEERFPPTRYELLNSPHAAPIVGSWEGAQMAEMGRAVDPDLSHMAVSLVAFLTELPGGLKPVLRLWRAGSLAANLQAVYGVGLAELDERWRETVATLGPQGEGWALERGRGLIREGRLEEAFVLVQEAYLAADSDGAAAAAIARELGRIHLLRGEWGAARARFQQAQDRGESVERDLQLVDAHSEWTTVVVGGTRVHTAPDLSLPYDFGERLVAELAEMRRRLGSDATPFPVQPVIFVGRAPANGMASDLRAGVAVAASQQELRRRLAELVAFHLWRDQSRSPLLERGLVRFLSAPEDHLARMQNHFHTEDWIPLHLLDFANFPAPIVEPLAAGLVDYLLTNYGQEDFHKLWRITSTLGGGRSLDTALSIVYGFTRRQLEERLQRTW